MRRGLAIVGAVALCAPTVAQADVCYDGIDEPIRAPMRGAGLDTLGHACARDEVAFRLDGIAAVDTPNFYGNLGAQLWVDARVALGTHWEAGLGLRVPAFDFFQNAVLKATDLSYGPVRLHGGYGRDFALGRGRWAGHLALDLPFTQASLDTTSLGTAATGHVAWRTSSSTTVSGRAGLMVGHARSSGGSVTNVAALAGGDLTIILKLWITLSVGAEVQAGWTGGLDHALVRAGTHWRVKGPWRLGVGTAVRALGDDPRDLAVTFAVRRDR